MIEYLIFSDSSKLFFNISFVPHEKKAIPNNKNVSFLNLSMIINHNKTAAAIMINTNVKMLMVTYSADCSRS